MWIWYDWGYACGRDKSARCKHSDPSLQMDRWLGGLIISCKLVTDCYLADCNLLTDKMLVKNYMLTKAKAANGRNEKRGSLHLINRWFRFCRRMHMQRDAKFAVCRSALADPSNSRGACGSNDTQTIFSRLDFRILLYKPPYITLDLIALSIPTWRKRRRMMLWH